MVQKRVFPIRLLGFLLLTLNIFQISFATNSSEPRNTTSKNLRQKLLYDLVELAKDNNIEVRDPIDLEDNLTTLDCSDTALRKLHPNAWSRPVIKANDNQLLLLWKSGKYILVEGGQDVAYQPLYHTEQKIKYSLSGLENAPKSYGKHTLLVVTEDSLASATLKGKTIILKPGFHWLKKGERNFDFISLSQWLKQVENCDEVSDNQEPSSEESSSSSSDDDSDSSSDSDNQPAKKNKKPVTANPKPLSQGCVRHTQFAGLTLEKVIPNNAKDLIVRKNHDGLWSILKPGINLYAAGLAPIGRLVHVKRLSFHVLKNPLSIASSGIAVSAHFTITMPTEKQFASLKQTHTLESSYAEYLLYMHEKFTPLTKRIGNTLVNALSLHLHSVDSTALDLPTLQQDLKRKLESLADTINEQQKQKSQLMIKNVWVDIDTSTTRQHQAEIGSLHRSAELNNLKRDIEKHRENSLNEDKDKTTDHDDARQEKRVAAEHQRIMEKLRLENERKSLEAQAEKAKAEAHMAKEKRKKFEHKQASLRQ